jgi:calmodulin
MSAAEWSEAFRMMDQKGAGSIPSAKFGGAVRAGGQYPTEAQVREMLEKVDPGGRRGTVSLDQFLEQMKWIDKKNPLDLNKIGESFKMFDKDDNGMISSVELHHILISLGEKLTSEEADEFIKGARKDMNGNIKYMDFLKDVTDY